ncbi:Uncharacterised protein [Mycobacterium tuberculosis]|nr:Uncharacterised protein [Mycobacterium tuberculosis]CFA23511.1 Uncharacterised protein [Mycobacterium tuberculosis]CKN11405.1 Uncharacterised protein [Mycobacterium tuberculosis]CKW65440.1 Uncharacterised protein [Mycobacterium tuberculosis]CKW65457.1 Uncharacterised protein [Mycobacterium tuberculosis]
MTATALAVTTPAAVPPTPRTPFTTAAAVFTPVIGSGTPGMPMPGMPMPGMPMPGMPTPGTLGAARFGRAGGGGRAGPAAPGMLGRPGTAGGPTLGTAAAAGTPGRGTNPGAIVSATGSNGAGTACSAAAGPDGVAVSGIRTAASRSHCWPALQVPPATRSGVDNVNGATASVPPIAAAAAVPTIASLITNPSRTRHEIDTRRWPELRRTRHTMWALCQFPPPAGLPHFAG